MDWFDKILENDLDSNFFNEFAERIDFSGIRLTAMISKEEYDKKYHGRNRWNKDKDDTGIQKEGIVLSIKVRDIPKKLKINIGDKVSVNGIKYEVELEGRTMGVYKIVLKRFQFMG